MPLKSLIIYIFFIRIFILGLTVIVSYAYGFLKCFDFDLLFGKYVLNYR